MSLESEELMYQQLPFSTRRITAATMRRVQKVDACLDWQRQLLLILNRSGGLTPEIYREIAYTYHEARNQRRRLGFRVINHPRLPLFPEDARRYFDIKDSQNYGTHSRLA
jgi:hypothetical protein